MEDRNIGLLGYGAWAVGLFFWHTRHPWGIYWEQVAAYLNWKYMEV
jgi:hypothetical protein